MSEQMKRTLILFVAVLGIGLIGLAFYYFANRAVLEPEGNQNNATNKTVQKEVALPKPTGKADDAIEAAEAGVLSESNLLKEEESSANAVISDDSEVSSFSQIYNESEL